MMSALGVCVSTPMCYCSTQFLAVSGHVNLRESQKINPYILTKHHHTLVGTCMNNVIYKYIK